MLEISVELYLVIVVEEDDRRSVTDSVAVLTSAELYSQSVSLYSK